MAEELNDSTYVGFGMCVYDLTEDDIELVVKAFRKVWSNLEALKDDRVHGY